MTEANRPLAGITWMLLTGLLFVGVTASVKYGAQDLPAAQAAFLRYLIGLVFLVPLLRRVSLATLTARDWRLFALRGAFHTLAVILWFYAMTRIPLAEVAALNYLSPIYITLLATLVLGERLVPARVLAVAAALCGTLMILRPGFREIGDGHVAMLAAALVFAGSYLTAKVLTGRATAALVVVMLSVTVTIGLAPFALVQWQTPTGSELLWLTVTAALATGGHYAMTLAFAAAPITVTQPVTFLQLVWATLLGFALFGEAIDALSVAGGAVIALAVILLGWSEAAARRKRARMAMGPDQA
jgi:drug/metabolite transporter (DMT)-like permease